MKVAYDILKDALINMLDTSCGEDYENKSLWEAHEIAERVHKDVEQRFSDIKHIMLHDC